MSLSVGKKIIHHQGFPDTGNATIAGYGRYKRPPCEAGSKGPDKFEYCGMGKECYKGSQVKDLIGFVFMA